MSKHHNNGMFDDAHERQRNTVFPDTVRNEGEFYRGIATGPLTRAGKIGFALLSVFVIGPLAMVIHAVIADANATPYPSRAMRIASILVTLGVIAGGTALFIGILYLAFRHGVQRFAAQHRGRFRRSLP